MAPHEGNRWPRLAPSPRVYTLTLLFLLSPIMQYRISPYSASLPKRESPFLLALGVASVLLFPLMLAFL